MAERLAPEAQAGAFLPESPFVNELVKLLRAYDTRGIRNPGTDDALLAPYIVTRQQRREIPIMGNPDAKTLWRLELFYNAVGMLIERRAGVAVSPLMQFHHEGFGRVILAAGRLVVVSRYLRDVHRFGFDSVETLAQEGEKHAAAGVEMIRRFPEAARYG